MSGRSRTRVIILQGYVPEYRRSFFDMLRQRLASGGIDLTLAVGGMSPDQQARNDEAELPWTVRVSTKSYRVGGRNVMHRSLGPLIEGCDLVVAEQMIRYSGTWVALLSQRVRRQPVALWGHGRCLSRQHRFERWMARELTLRAHWFLAYTEGSCRLVAEIGFPNDRITVVRNTNDPERLAELQRRVSENACQSIRSRLRLTSQGVGLFVGALDRSKRLEFLLESVTTVRRWLPGFSLIVAGDGPLRGDLERIASTQTWLHVVGRQTGADLAGLARVSDMILCPSGVGLVAVDSFALERPLVTTNAPGHGPEFEYLVDGINSMITRDDVANYAAAIVELKQSTATQALLQGGCRQSAMSYSIAEMVERFATGVESALAAAPRYRSSRRIN